MSPDKPDKPDSSEADIYTKPANGATAGSYFTDGRYNIGGWSTYPSMVGSDDRTKGRPSGDPKRPKTSR